MSTSNVIGLKLTNSNEILCQLSKAMMLTEGGVDLTKLPDSLTVDKARLVLMQQTKEGLMVDFAPWIMSNFDATLTVNRATIAAIFEPDAEMVKSYLTQVSGIQLL